MIWRGRASVEGCLPDPDDPGPHELAYAIDRTIAVIVLIAVVVKDL